MLLILALMFLGILAGYIIIPRQKSQTLIKSVGQLQSAATITLLFCMGVWLGGNEEFWDNLQVTGTSGILFAVFTILGSVAAVYLISRLFFRKGGDAR